ncbi:hypothetical protein [Kineococcus rubinsiae]|uniref:hypothetical protein n=1 Tax=Kineococcus rubinsiae TaxID=2609562 RepID=UPI0014316FCE|nr:hypothetical protein [Kineococcus rubinsiae]NIZ90427.1 hypothetical protein [Kineococcus rubinsiae]
MDVQDDQDGDEAVAPERGSVVAWVLAVAAAVPVAAAVETARRVMTGALDRVYTATYGGYPSPSAGLRQRFQWLISEVPVGSALVASTVGVLVVAALHLSGREPGRWPRAVAAAVGAAVTVAGLGFAAAVVYYVARPPASTPATVAFVNQYPAFVQFAPQLAEVALTVVLSVAAAVALLRRPRAVPGPVASPQDVVPPAAEAAPVVAAPASAPAQASAAPPEPALPEPAPQDAVLRPIGAALPRPDGDDYALYRRPQP